MKTKLLSTAAMSLLLFACTGSQGPGKLPPKEVKVAAPLNQIQEASLETTGSNQTDESNLSQASLFLTKYDKDNNQAVASIGSHFESAAGTNFVPYLREVCFNGEVCGITFTSIASLENITLDQAYGEMNRAGLKPASATAKNLFVNGSLILLHSVTRENKTQPWWEITVAIELKNFQRNSRQVKLRYKVLEYKMK